ncbi:Lrp/AsnC family transcriptional regulator [Chloroflexota bacterium]
MDNLDATDNKIIKLLEENAWQRSETLAKVLNVSSSTIRRRLRRLIQKGVLRAVAITDSSTVALPLTTIIALNIAHQDLDYVTRKLADLLEVKWCWPALTKDITS